MVRKLCWLPTLVVLLAVAVLAVGCGSPQLISSPAATPLPTFSYDDCRHTVWFNDGETLAGRLALLREKHPTVAGIAIWPLGGEDPANWMAIRAVME